MKTKDKTESEPDQKKKKKQKSRWNFSLDLPSGQTVDVLIVQGKETVERKVKVEVGAKMFFGTPVPVYHTMRTKAKKDKDGNVTEKGKIITKPMKVPGVGLTVTFEDGTKLTARSCCKPPDVFDAALARRIALNRLFLQDSGINPARICYSQEKRIDAFINNRKLTPMRDAIRDENVEERLSGQDRKTLFYAVLRNGKAKKAQIKKVDQPAPEGAKTNAKAG